MLETLGQSAPTSARLRHGKDRDWCLAGKGAKYQQIGEPLTRIGHSARRTKFAFR
jgi:hypothetical protein